MPGTVDREAYRYVPGPFQYSAGVAAKAGFALQRARFTRPVPLAEGFQRIETFLTQRGLPLTAFAACELRSPAPFTDAGFTAFNREYVGTLERWGLFKNDANPIARSNVCPELDKPDAPSFYAFTFATPSPVPPFSFVVAGSGESIEGPGPYRDRTIRHGDTSPEAMREKIAHVMGILEQRMLALGGTWSDTTALQAYTVFDIFPHIEAITARSNARHGLDWHLCRPPILDVELDCRSIFTELVLPV